MNWPNRMLLEERVFTERVVGALDSKRLAKAAHINRIVDWPCFVSAEADGEGLLVDASGAKQAISFKAKLGQDYMGAPAGTAVNATLKLTEGR